MSKSKLPAEIVSRLASVSDAAVRKRLNSRARYLSNTKGYSVTEILSELFADSVLTEDSVGADRTLSGQATDMSDAGQTFVSKATDIEAPKLVELQNSVGADRTLEQSVTENSVAFLTGTHDGGGKLIPIRGGASRSLTNDVKPKAVPAAPVTPPTHRVVPAQLPMSAEPQVTHSFRVCDPTVLDASKPAWKFCETISEPERVSPASGETLEQKAISQKPLDLVEWLQVNFGLYAVSRLVLYAVIIAISRQPVDSLFQALDIFGTQAINSAAALIVTVTTDLIAMNLFGRAADSFWHRQSHKIEACLCFVVPAIAIVATNIWLTQESLRSKANISVNQLAKTQWTRDLNEAKLKLSESEIAYSNTYGAFLSKKWAGAVNPEACESGEANCAGPYSSRSAGEQSKFVAAKSARDIAKASYNEIEAKRPTIANTHADEAGVTQKLMVYVVLWLGILLTYIYQPRKSLAI